MQVLLVEDNNLDQTTSLRPNLEANGYDVCLADTPDSAVQKALAHWPNLVIFHPVQGNLDLAEIQQAIHETDLNLPYIIIASKEQLQIPLSRDTILISPGKLHQLNQGIEKATIKQKDRFLRLPDLIIDCQQYKVLRGGKNYWLTPKEFKLLSLLIDNREQILKRKTIMQEVWETDYMGDTRTLDVHIRWLREKIEENPSQPRHLLTVRGVGYRFIVDPTSEAK
jgi:DNA-binding response OmpR family regulator